MTSTEPAQGNPTLEAAKDAIARRDWVLARHILTSLVQERSNGTAAFFMARVEVEEGNPDAAEPWLDAFLETRPNHAGGRVLKARVHLLRDEPGKAKAEAFAALDIEPNHALALRILSDIANQKASTIVRDLIKTIDNWYLKARENGPTPAVIEAAKKLTRIEPGLDWNEDPVQAKVAYFCFAPDIDAALQNYDAELIEVSTRFDYITWPKRIQEHVRGKSVIDVGCGFGGYGMGFLVAGAKDYAGLDPVMKLDSTRAKNKRTRTWSDMGVTPDDIVKALPAIRLLEGISEDLSFDEKFDTIALNNVTEHLIQLDEVFAGLVPLCKSDASIVYLHHNFYGWNGHHFSPNRPAQLDENDAAHKLVYDWRHIDLAQDLPADHYFKTHLNRVRLDEIRSITDKYFDVETWQEIPSSKETLARLTPDILDRLRTFMPDIQERELTTNAVLCVARPKPDDAKSSA